MTADTSEQKYRPGTLYVVATPIGDPDDISVRALRILRSVSYIAAENPTVTCKLLEHHGIETPVSRLKSQRGSEGQENWIERLRGGEAIALVTDAGTPTIADPGTSLLHTALNENLPVAVIPGPSAFLVALLLSGLSHSHFVFHGFPPKPREEREEFFQTLCAEKHTILLYESSRYLCSTLKILAMVLGENRKVAIVRDVTKPSEQAFRGSLAEAQYFFQSGVKRGEYTLVVAAQKT